MEFPVFVISIDTELLWGVAYLPNHPAFELMRANPSKTRKAIYDLLSLFEQHNVPATWAVVGHLFLNACDGLHSDLFAEKQSWCRYDPGSDFRSDPLYYGRDLIEAILGSKVEHEIGYHSFSHVRFSDCSEAAAEAEILAGIKLAKDFGIKLRSFVFPENDVSHLDILKRNDFAIFRGQSRFRWSADQNFVIRGLNAAIDKISIGSALPEWRDGLWETNSNLSFDGLCVPYALHFRAISGLQLAIKSRQVYHLSFHPYDLLLRPTLLKYLDKFLTKAAAKRNRSVLKIMTMSGLSAYLDKERNRHAGTQPGRDQFEETSFEDQTSSF
jgi:peptidoglycan/xylan/chitin deacetylase (PgdA/CDA1 family)